VDPERLDPLSGSNNVFEFSRTGRLGFLAIGVPVARVMVQLGTADGVTAGSPSIHAFRDVQLGFSRKGILWHIAVEPSGHVMTLPQPIGPAEGIPTPKVFDFLRYLRTFSVAVEKCEPFSSGEFWLRVGGSGVLLNFDEEGFLTAAHYSETSLLQ